MAYGVVRLARFRIVVVRTLGSTLVLSLQFVRADVAVTV